MLKRFDSIAADLRFGFRRFGHTPCATLTMIAVLEHDVGPLERAGQCSSTGHQFVLTRR